MNYVTQACRPPALEPDWLVTSWLEVVSWGESRRALLWLLWLNMASGTNATGSVELVLKGPTSWMSSLKRSDVCYLTSVRPQLSLMLLSCVCMFPKQPLPASKPSVRAKAGRLAAPPSSSSGTTSSTACRSSLARCWSGARWDDSYSDITH